jgi:hypothetical protein
MKKRKINQGPLEPKINEEFLKYDFSKDPFIIRKNKEARKTLKKCGLPKEWLEEYNKEPNS